MLGFIRVDAMLSRPSGKQKWDRRHFMNAEYSTNGRQTPSITPVLRSGSMGRRTTPERPHENVECSAVSRSGRIDRASIADGVRCGVQSDAQNVRGNAQNVLKCATC